jgi:hypothetical protein
MARFKSAVPACPHCHRKGKGYHEGPMGYVAWHEWAEQMGKTHDQFPCPSPGCHRLTIWRKKT